MYARQREKPRYLGLRSWGFFATGLLSQSLTLTKIAWRRRSILINSVVKKKKNNGSDNSEQYLNILFRNGEI